MAGFNVGRFRRHVIPFTVWLIGLLVLGLLFVQRQTRLEMRGMVLDDQTKVASYERGMIKQVMVTLYQPVEQGQVLAVLDDTMLRLQLVLIKAELDLLKARLQMQKETEQRRFITDVEKARLDILKIKTDLEPDKIELLDRAYEVQLLEELVARDATPMDELTKAKFELDVLKKKVETGTNQLKQAEIDLENKQARALNFKGTDAGGDSSLEYIRKSLNVETLKIQDIEARLKNLVIRAPIHGVVTEIRAKTGDVAMEGQTIFTVITSKPREVLGYLSEQQVAKVQKGDAVALLRQNQDGTRLSLTVNYVGPAVEVLPERLWMNPQFPQYGVPVSFLLPEETELIPGEVVQLIKKL